MRKAFTLLELLIVVAIIVTLMVIVFRIGNLGSDSDRRNRTIVRMQRLENCLSGYYAAFGSYPPVKLHGTRDIYQSVGTHGVQTDERNENLWGWNRIGDQSEQDAWRQVEAACRSQPVACRFPFPDSYHEVIRLISDAMREAATNGGDENSGFTSDPVRQRQFQAGFDEGSSGRFSKNRDKVDWRNIQLFKFGVLSFLLPRYLVMMNGDSEYFTDFSQWTGNNVMPSDPFTGNTFSTWQQVKNFSDDSGTRSQLARIANIPSQSICARWMPNLEGICHCNHSFTLFGVDINSGDLSALRSDNYNIEIFSPDDADSGSCKDQYILDSVTLEDGWWRELYYYSPEPYQTYTVWSAGANGRTFPPWISRKKLSSKANQCVSLWTEDDIIHMSN